MMKKALQSVYFIGMRKKFDDYVKACFKCIERRPMKPALSRVLTERASYPFEVITMDFLEFRKAGESFIILGDKYSGALQMEGLRKGGTTQETINTITNFARSSVGRIKFIKK